MPWAGFSLARLVGQWIGLRQNGRAETLPMIAALVLLGAVCFTLVAAYQLTMFADRDWQIVTWSAVMAVILWLVWFYGITPA
jgi:uncharacterized membrane protein